MTLCEYCNKPLRAIGHARKNGKNHNDWSTRKLHKKCWKLQLDIAAQNLNFAPENNVKCLACNDTGRAYWSDGIYGECFQC